MNFWKIHKIFITKNNNLLSRQIPLTFNEDIEIRLCRDEPSCPEDVLIRELHAAVFILMNSLNDCSVPLIDYSAVHVINNIIITISIMHII